MPLRETQVFLTRYMREPIFREQWKGGGKEALQTEIGLTAQDLDMLSSIPIEDMDLAADGLRDDRLKKRQSEFRYFLEFLGQYMQEDNFLKAFDATYTGGWQRRSIEIDWFLAFATKFISANGLPDYLQTLLRFCYHYTKIATAPEIISENTVLNPSEAGVEPYHMVRLRQPYCVEAFRYDAYGLSQTGAQPNMIPELDLNQLLMVKNYKYHNRSIIWRMRDLPPFVAVLADGPKMVSSLIGLYDTVTYPEIVAELLNFHDEGIIEFLPPSHHLA
ncbi:MAG: hypothetical protein JKX85_01680 [Phycisphaeraceae bacterium]|nr:hypothetical protein [Phycisphaeraceae bacterium]